MRNNLEMEVRPGRFGPSVLLVSVYLIIVGFWLVLTKRISAPPLGKLLKSYFRRRYRGRLQAYLPEQGKCFISPVPSELISDAEGTSSITLLEDGVPLPHGHAAHDDIRTKGAGRYSHWGPQVFFSASDNSNPMTNRKVYEIVEL